MSASLLTIWSACVLPPQCSVPPTPKNERLQASCLLGLPVLLPTFPSLNHQFSEGAVLTRCRYWTVHPCCRAACGG